MPTISNSSLSIFSDGAESWWTEGLSHDMANLLTVIQTAGEELVTATPQQKPFVDAILEACRRGASMLTPTRRWWSRYDSGEKEIRVSEIVEQVVRFEAMNFSNVEFSLNIRNGLKHEVPTPVLFRILQNIVRNAAEATLENVQAQHRRVDIAADGNSEVLRLTIRDYGGGIPTELQQRLFDPLFTTKVTRLSERRGLGLYVVKSLLDHYEGTIQVHSSEGFGATVYVELPVASASSSIECDRANVSQVGDS